MIDYKGLLEDSRSIFDKVRAFRNHIHKNPELSFKEHNTCKYICSILECEGIEYSIIAPTSIIAVISNNDNNHKNCIALRADIDALPITEDISINNHAENGVMHACGHDIHTASLIGALILLNKKKSDFNGTVIGIFQMGEEVLPGGASVIINSGILQKYNPKTIIGQHVEYRMNVGEFGVCKGLYMASADEIFIKVKGKGGHAATPDLIKDPVLAASQIVVSLQQLSSRNAPRTTPTVISIGKIIANGATNIVPDEVLLEGTFRTFDEQWRKVAKTRIAEIVNGIAISHGVEVELNIVDGYPMLKNDEKTASKVVEVLKNISVNNNVEELGIRLSSEDFGVYSQYFNTLFYRLGVKATEEINPKGTHTSKFNPDEQSLIYGVASMNSIALYFLNESINQQQ